MGHREPTTGFAWPVPPEELADVQVFVLEWSADGRVMVRQQPVVARPPRNAALPRLALARVEASPRPEAGGAAPLRIQLAWTVEPAAGSALRRPVVRDRATWLGIGTVMGIALAASTLPDASTGVNGRRALVEIPGPPVVTPAGPPEASPALRRVTAVVADTPPVVAPARERRGVQGIVDVAPAATARRPAPDARTRPRTPRPSAATTTAVLQEVRRYEVAYTRMDAAATHAVWPSADRESLVRQFTGLREQYLRLERCVVEGQGDAALVTCRGTLRYRPRLGDHSTRVHRGAWRFALERRADGWVIASVDAPAEPPSRLP